MPNHMYIPPMKDAEAQYSPKGAATENINRDNVLDDIDQQQHKSLDSWDSDCDSPIAYEIHNTPIQQRSMHGKRSSGRVRYAPLPPAQPPTVTVDVQERISDWLRAEVLARMMVAHQRSREAHRPGDHPAGTAATRISRFEDEDVNATYNDILDAAVGAEVLSVAVETLREFVASRRLAAAVVEELKNLRELQAQPLPFTSSGTIASPSAPVEPTTSESNSERQDRKDMLEELRRVRAAQEELVILSKAVGAVEPAPSEQSPANDFILASAVPIITAIPTVSEEYKEQTEVGCSDAVKDIAKEPPEQTISNVNSADAAAEQPAQHEECPIGSSDKDELPKPHNQLSEETPSVNNVSIQADLTLSEYATIGSSEVSSFGLTILSTEISEGEIITHFQSEGEIVQRRGGISDPEQVLEAQDRRRNRQPLLRPTDSIPAAAGAATADSSSNNSKSASSKATSSGEASGFSDVAVVEVSNLLSEGELLLDSHREDETSVAPAGENLALTRARPSTPTVATPQRIRREAAVESSNEYWQRQPPISEQEAREVLSQLSELSSLSLRLSASGEDSQSGSRSKSSRSSRRSGSTGRSGENDSSWSDRSALRSDPSNVSGRTDDLSVSSIGSHSSLSGGRKKVMFSTSTMLRHPELREEAPSAEPSLEARATPYEPESFANPSTGAVERDRFRREGVDSATFEEGSAVMEGGLSSVEFTSVPSVSSMSPP
ncbi:hypothetical protein DFJ73DRAFT_155576 [Zopfochytrium polystomum]|nr:hypothetical protein DFJ73DRAFT_155576 [Zopfochytrium polystomum]